MMVPLRSPIRCLTKMFAWPLCLLTGLILHPVMASAQSVQLSGGTTLLSGVLPQDFRAADVDRDGNLDLVVSYASKNGYPSGLAWYKGPQMPGHAIWSSKPTDMNPVFYYIAVDDFNNDGKMDLVGLTNQELDWIPSIADAGTTKTVQKIMGLPGIQRCTMTTGDLNKDGYVDIVGSFRAYNNFGPDTLFWFENGKGTNPSFIKHQIPSTITNPYRIVVTDLNGDGNLDIVLSGYGNGTAIYLNNGANPPVFTEDHLTTDSCMADVKDLNGDGKPDILTTVFYSGGMDWLENDGATPPRFIRHHLSNLWLGNMKLCDLDQDGDLDIAGNDYDQNTNTFYLGYLENLGGQTPTYKYHLLKTLNDPVTQLLIAPLGPNHRWQYVVGQWNNYVASPSGWITVYDTIVTRKTGVKGDAWNLYR